MNPVLRNLKDRLEGERNTSVGKLFSCQESLGMKEVFVSFMNMNSDDFHLVGNSSLCFNVEHRGN